MLSFKKKKKRFEANMTDINMGVYNIFSLVIHIKIFRIKHTSDPAQPESKWCHRLSLILEEEHSRQGSEQGELGNAVNYLAPSVT